MNDKAIKIDHLTIYQKHLLDEIWSRKTQTQLTEWLATLPTSVLHDVTTLMEILMLEVIDMEEDLDTSDTKLYLKKFML